MCAINFASSRMKFFGSICRLFLECVVVPLRINCLLLRVFCTVVYNLFLHTSIYVLRYLNTNRMDIVKQKIKVHLPLDTTIILNNLFDPIRIILCQIIRQLKKKHKVNFLSMLSYGNINWIYCGISKTRLKLRILHCYNRMKHHSN